MAVERMGAAIAQGRMDHLEDRVVVVEYDERLSLACVFDGHGGHIVADYCTDRVPELVKGQLLLQGDKQDHGAALKAALGQLDPGLREAYAGRTEEIGGSTALVALLDRAAGRLTLAYLGDGRAILCRSGVAKQLNVEHNPCNPEERARVLAVGGSIDEDDRVEAEDCSLSVSRSVGDFDYKLNEGRPAEEQVVISVPDLTGVLLDAEDEFLILSSDGTQCWTNQELVDFVRPRTQLQDLSSVCEDLLREVDGIDNMGLLTQVLNTPFVFLGF